MNCPKCKSLNVTTRPERELVVGAIRLPAGTRWTCRHCKYGWLTGKDGKIVA